MNKFRKYQNDCFTLLRLDQNSKYEALEIKDKIEISMKMVENIQLYEVNMED